MDAGNGLPSIANWPFLLLFFMLLRLSFRSFLPLDLEFPDIGLVCEAGVSFTHSFFT
jgi:hypothetical protein